MKVCPNDLLPLLLMPQTDRRENTTSDSSATRLNHVVICADFLERIIKQSWKIQETDIMSISEVSCLYHSLLSFLFRCLETT